MSWKFGSSGRCRPRPWLNWFEFFRSIAGQPQIVVGDAGHAWQLAVPIAWPTNTPEMVISEFHLREMLDAHLTRIKVPDGDPLIGLARAALAGPTEWAGMVAALTPTAQRNVRLRKVAGSPGRRQHRDRTQGARTEDPPPPPHVREPRQDEPHAEVDGPRGSRRAGRAQLVSDRGHLAGSAWWPIPIQRQITDDLGGPRQASSLRQGGAPN